MITRKAKLRGISSSTPTGTRMEARFGGDIYNEFPPTALTIITDDQDTLDQLTVGREYVINIHRKSERKDDLERVLHWLNYVPPTSIALEKDRQLIERLRAELNGLEEPEPPAGGRESYTPPKGEF